MKYIVAFARRVICRQDIMDTLPFIPDTERAEVLDTESGPGKEIWDGYLKMCREQKSAPPLDDSHWYKIRVPEDSKPENEINRFREAINIFMRFLAGEGRDNCEAVKDIKRVYTIRISSNRGLWWSARCDCLWVSVDKQRLRENINAHISLHESKDKLRPMLVGEVAEFSLNYPKLPGKKRKRR